MARERVCDSVVRQIEQLILEGAPNPATGCLPNASSPRNLAYRAPSYARACRSFPPAALVTRRGGATEVTESLNPALENPLLELISASPDAQEDVMELRHAIESMAAYRAAARRTQTDIELLEPPTSG